jgi:hypothetical protein
MLEILIVVTLCKKMGELMRARGYEKPFWFQFFVPVFWLGGEFLGAFIYGIGRALRSEPAEGFDIKVYLVAIVAAALSTTLLFAIARSFRSRLPEDSQFDQ